MSTRIGINGFGRVGRQVASLEQVYRLVGRVGGSCEAEVHRAIRQNDGALVAVRVPTLRFPSKPELERMYAMFKEAAQTWWDLSNPKFGTPHPNIVQLVEYGLSPYPWLALEYVGGGDLRERLWPEPRSMSVQQSLEIAVQICDALGYAHCAGVVHRDVRPENVLFTTGGVPKLSNLGAARRFLDLPMMSFETERAYSSPENLSIPTQPGEVDQQADVFPMGILLYELFTGRYPFTDDGTLPDERSLQQCITDPAYVPPCPSTYRSGLPAGLDNVIMKALAKSRASRYYNGNQLRDELQRIALERA